MLATWFFAYSEGEVSTRQLESKCKFDTRYMYTSGMLMPDHSTLSRFRKNNLDLMQEYFVKILLLAKQKGLSDFKSIAIDGTKIQASASAKKSKNSESLARYLAAVRHHIAEYMQRCDKHELVEGDHEEDDPESVQAKIRDLKELEKTLLERQKQLETRKQNLKKEYRQKHQINLVEPDAPNMSLGSAKPKAPAYNAQVSTDRKTQLIVANDVVTDRNDSQLFQVQHQAIENNLGNDSQRQFDTDSGYHSLEQLEFIEQNLIDAVIVDPAPKNRSVGEVLLEVKELLEANEPLSRGHFSYHSQENYYLCPAGHKLRPRTSKGKRAIYIADSNDCGACVLRHLCLSSKNRSGARNLVRDHREGYAENMFAKLQSDEAKNRIKRRATSVEPVIGNLKENLGFRRFKLRGLVSVRGKFALMCIAHNLNKLFQSIGDLVDLFLSKTISMIKPPAPLSRLHSLIKLKICHSKPKPICNSLEGGNPVITESYVRCGVWMPAFAGMTVLGPFWLWVLLFLTNRGVSLNERVIGQDRKTVGSGLQHLHDLGNHFFRVAKKHHGLFVIEQLVIFAGKSH
jgi:transposase